MRHTFLVLYISGVLLVSVLRFECLIKSHAYMEIIPWSLSAAHCLTRYVSEMPET